MRRPPRYDILIQSLCSLREHSCYYLYARTVCSLSSPGREVPSGLDYLCTSQSMSEMNFRTSLPHVSVLGLNFLLQVLLLVEYGRSHPTGLDSTPAIRFGWMDGLRVVCALASISRIIYETNSQDSCHFSAYFYCNTYYLVYGRRRTRWKFVVFACGLRVVSCLFLFHV